MANDEKPTPPEPRPRAQAPAAPDYQEVTDWEREVAAWDPSFSPETPPPAPLSASEPPPAESADLVLDDVSSGEVILVPAAINRPASEPGEHRAAVLHLYGDDDEPTLVAPPPGAEPESFYPAGQESSGVLVIPAIAELEAAASGPPGIAAAFERVAAPPPSKTPLPTPPPALASREPGRELTDDGLPDVSALFADRLPQANPQGGGWTAGPAPGGGAFEDELPVEEPPTLDLAFPTRFRPLLEEIIDAAAAFAGDGTPVDEVADLKALLQICTEEINEPEGAAHAAVAAGRTAERLGSADALPFYEQALALDQGYAPALRGRLRALVGAGRLGEAREATAALANVAPGEGALYRLLLEHTRPLTPEGAEGEPGVEESEAVPGRLLLACERALAADNRSLAAARLERLAEHLPGELQPSLRGLAALLFESAGDFPAADRARQALSETDPLRSGFASIRAALRLPPSDAIERLVAAVESLPPSPLGAGLLRWAARLARAQNQPERARLLLDRVQGGAEGWATLPLLDAVDVISGVADSAPLDSLLPRLEQADPDQAALAACRLILRLISDGRTGDALEIVRSMRQRPGAAEPSVLGSLAERIAVAAADRDDRLAAWQLWGELDLARAPTAAALRAQALLRHEATRGDGLRVLQQLARRDGQDAVFWWLSWFLRRDGQSAAAAEALVSGASSWVRPPLERVAAALRERARELDLAARPENLVTYLPSAAAVATSPDDPALLVRELLAPGREPRTLAETFKQAAGRGSPYRVLEAAGWLVQAGAYGEALAWVTEVIPRAASLPPTNLFLERLVGMVHDPALQVAVLGDLILANRGADDLSGLEFRQAEALERAGRRREATGLYRELLDGPLHGDAELALRRGLWTLRDAEQLEAIWRDEYDAHSGAGRTRGAALALLERGRIDRELRGKFEPAQGKLSAARLLDPDRIDVRVSLLVLPDARPSAVEVVTLLEELAQEMPAEAVSVFFLAALIADGQGHPETAQRLLREALQRAGTRPSLALVRRHVATEENRSPPAPDLPDLLEARAESIAITPGADARLGTSLLTRAAEVEEDAGRFQKAEQLLGRALELEPEHLPALVRLRRLLVGRGAFSQAVDALELEARALRRPTRRGQALLQAAILADEELANPGRARHLLERALETDPRNDLAFARLRKLLEAEGELDAVADLLARRAAGAPAREVTALRLERVDLLLGPLGDRPAAKRELRTLLETEPDNAAILARLSALEMEDGDFGAAAELAIKQARFERDPAALEACFLLIGRIYLRRLNDPRVALGAYERVLRIAPSNREALEALSDLYSRQNDTRKAIVVSERLVEQETDPDKRLPFLVRLGALWEAAGDMRRAGVMLRRAVDEAPRNLQAVGELARFHERHKELQARNVLLEGALSLLTTDLRVAPDNLETLRTMIPILRWRQRRTSAVSAAQLLGRYTLDPEESREAAAWVEVPKAGRRLAPLANPELDERALPRRVQGGIRHILRLLGPTLAHASRPDLRRWQVGRADRRRTGADVRQEFDAVAADLGVRSFELYISEGDPRALAVEPGDPPVIVVGSGIVKQGRPALRFAAGWCLRLVETHFDLLLENTPMEAAALMAAVVRRFLYEYQSPDLADGPMAAAEARVSRALGKIRRAELAPFANEIAGSFSPNGLYLDAQETAARAGLLACGDLSTSLDVIAAAAGRLTPSLGAAMEIPVAARLVDFALSEDHEELAQALDAVTT